MRRLASLRSDGDALRQGPPEAREIIKALPDEAWVRCSAGRGTRGERLYDWLYCPMADLEAAEFSDTSTGIWTRGLLARRNPADGDLAGNPSIFSGALNENSGSCF